jgi:DNA-binding transcriptional LysR family regulator
MEIRQVRVFLTLAEELHFGRSARRLGVVQSAVSQTLRALEQEIGAELFERSKRHVALSAAGRAFMAPAQRALEEFERAKASARSVASGESGELRIRCTMMAALTALPATIAEYQRRYPEVRVQVASSGSVEQLLALREWRCDVGFMPKAAAKVGSERDRSLLIEPLTPDPLAAVFQRGAPLAKRQKLHLRELAPLPLVFLNQRDEPQVYTRFREDCAAAGFEPNVTVQVESIEAALAFAAAGVGVACLPSSIRRMSFPGVSVVPLEPTIKTLICAVWRRTPVSATATRFIELLRSHARQGQ